MSDDVFRGPIGAVLPDWTARAMPPDDLRLQGRYVTLRIADPDRDAAPLRQAFEGAAYHWDYLGEKPFQSQADWHAALTILRENPERQQFAIIPKGLDAPLGYACYWTIAAEHGCIEIGNVNLSPALQGTPAATEAFSLMCRWAFAAGWRRVEWKCNALNAPSRRAAQRLGFSYEGIFRNHNVIRGRSRDTAWFGMTDSDWTTIAEAHDQWLAPENFDGRGRQKTSLSDLTYPHLAARDPTLTA